MNLTWIIYLSTDERNGQGVIKNKFITKFYIFVDVLIGSWFCPVELILINLGLHKISCIAFSASCNHDASSGHDVVEKHSVLIMYWRLKYTVLEFFVMFHSPSRNFRDNALTEDTSLSFHIIFHSLFDTV